MTTVTAVLADVLATRRDASALVCGSDAIRYGQLDALTAGAATTLARHGIVPGATVGLTVERSLLQVACLVAIVRAGRAFCFVDRRSPPAWNRDVIHRAGITHVVGGAGDDLGIAVSWIPVDELLAADVAAPVPVAPDDPVYVNFSSGTTGAPKVIPCTHRGVVGFCHAPWHFPAGPTSRFVYSSPLTFDASQLEIWMALLNGGCIIVNGEPYLTTDVVRRLVRRDGASSMWLTSSLFNALVDVDPTCLAGVRHLMTGGEELSPRHVEALYRADPAITVFNGYGPTETTIVTTIHEIPRDHDFTRKIPIGRPVRGSQLFVVGDGRRRCADDEVGELVIAGDGLSLGYLGDPGLTAEKFATLALDGDPGGSLRCYRTGDLVSRDAAGVFHYHGRKDDQLKVRGHRVSLSEVAHAFAAHPGIRVCAVIASDGAAGKQLTLCHVPVGTSLAAAELTAFGHARLPEFMVPRDFVALDALPLTSSGKVDRGALAARIAAGRADAAGHDDGGEVAAYLRRLVGLPDWPLDASFFDAGGDSLGAIKLVSMINRLVGAERLALEELYRTPTLAHLLAIVPPDLAARATAARAAPDEEYEPAPVPLPPAQRSMVYPEVFHGDRTRNNVVYLFQERVFGNRDVALADLHAALVARFPLLGCVVIDGDEGYAFAPPDTRAPHGVDPEVTEHQDVAGCVAHHLAQPISVFDGPLLALFRTRVGRRLHYGVRLHHIVGDHIGQTEILRAIVTLASGAATPPAPPERHFAIANRRLARRAEVEHDACAAFWAAQAIGVPEVAAQPVTAPTVATVRRRRLAGARRDRTPSEQMLRWLAATRAALEATFAVREPVVHYLFSLREDATGLGFQTCPAPVALTDERVEDGRPRPALLDALLAIRRHCVIGMEQIVLAAGLDGARVPFLFNFVDMRGEDYRWWGEHLVAAPSEMCKTELDLTVIRASDVFDVTVTTRFDAARADALLDALEACRPCDDD